MELVSVESLPSLGSDRAIGLSRNRNWFFWCTLASPQVAHLHNLANTEGWKNILKVKFLFIYVNSNPQNFMLKISL